MIAVTGNTLGDSGLDRLFRDATVQSMSRTDFLLIVGGCGVTEARADFQRRVEGYRQLPCSILFLDSSSDDYDLLAEHPVFPWNGGKVQVISRGILHLMRGQVFTIGGRRLFTMGGATTPGRTDLGKYHLWWPEQDIAPEDLAEAEENLSKAGWKADFAFSSTSPLDDRLRGIYGRLDCRNWFYPYQVTAALSGGPAVPVGNTVISLC